MSSTKLIALVAAVMILAFQASDARGQQPPPGPTPRPTSGPAQSGDVLWTFAFEPLLNDSRVALAVATGMDAQFRQAGERVFFVESRGPDLLPHVTEPPAPADQVPLLLKAAGFANGIGDAQVVGPCRIWWASPGPSTAAVTRVANAFRDSLANLGLEIDACLPTDDPAAADVLAWTQGSSPPVIPHKQQATFLALPGTGTPSAGNFVPPGAGDAGLKAAELTLANKP